MDQAAVLQKIRDERSPLLRQLTMVGLVGFLLEQQGKPMPVLIGGAALSYYSREVYFTSDIDLAYSDHQALDLVLTDLGFRRAGRYWIHQELDIAVEAPAGCLSGENAPREIVELEGGLRCEILGLEDLVIDRLNAYKYWESQIDGEMTELLIRRYSAEMDWNYLEQKAGLPENDTRKELQALRERISCEPGR